MDGEIVGDGWALVRRLPIDWDEVEWFSDVLPAGGWLWGSLERYCVAGCCGLAAFELTHEAVRWACGDELPAPEGHAWRDASPGDQTQLSTQLKIVARTLRGSDAPHANASVFCEPATPASYADLLDLVATWLVTPLPST